MNEPRKKIAVLTGAGISAESGLRTFRDAGGLWENYSIEEVATPMAWQRNPQLVLDFYNQRRRDVLRAQPNEGHHALVRLEQAFDVTIITQNIDDLHERAGSSKVMHLHGEILKVRSTQDERLLYPWTTDVHLGDCCELGSQLRPHVVWFYEPVPMMEAAERVVAAADIFIVVGTSLQVYPAAGLIYAARPNIPKYLIDPMPPESLFLHDVQFLQETASRGLPKLVSKLLNAH
ncbi:MAG: NAD-dependent deacylase [Chitinophagales bacterium]|nr:NAD-dependent deacylase [Chitinophagales bacterium]